MAKSLTTLVDDIYGILGSDVDHVVDEANVERTGEAFKELLRTRLRNGEAEGPREVLRFSALGKKDRQLWYKANMPETAEPMSPKTYFKFLYGDVLELLLLFLAREAGHEVVDEQRKVEVDGVNGSMDAIIDGVPVDCKSASPYSFNKFVSGDFLFDDPFGYISQLSGYAHAADVTEGAAFVVADKVHGDIAVAPLDKETIAANPPGERIAHLRRVLASETPPQRCYDDVPDGKSGNRKLGVGCSYCEFKHECWKDANNGQGLRTFVYSTGPKFLTHVAREPKVEESKE